MENYDVDKVIKTIFIHEDRTWKPADKIQLIVKELEYCKEDLKTFLGRSAIDIPDILKQSDELCSESNLLVEDFKNCKQDIEVETMAEIDESLDNYEHLSKELKTFNYGIQLITYVTQCGKLMKEFQKGVENEVYPQAIEPLCEILAMLDQPLDGFNDLELAAKTREIAQFAFNNIIQDLNTNFDHLLSITVKEASRKRVTTITMNIKDNMQCFFTVNGLAICKKLAPRVHEFADALMKEVLRPIIHCDSVVTMEDDQILTVTTSRKQSQRSPYTDVISKHMQVLEVLSKKLRFSLDEEKSMFEMIGEHLSAEYSEMIMHECFVYTIPKNIADLNNYESVAKDIGKFQQYLEDIQFFPLEGNISILSYIKDIEKHFAQSAARHLLETARIIMLKDLSVSMSIGVLGVESFPESTSSSSRSDHDALNRLEKNIPKSLFYFPRCMISKSAQELLDHLYTIMEQASQCEDVVCRKLYSVARMVFDLYEAVVPYHHEKYLQTIPQYVALFHNNCMYLAHNLLTFGDKWVQSLEGREVNYPVSFIDIVQKIRDLGYRHLTVHMQQQRKQILDNIRSSDLNCIVSKDVLSDNAEAAIRQCLRQLHLLKNVWIGVFPTNVFTRLMATLLNMFAEELIHRVCTVEDISAEMATQLSDMYSLVLQKAPLLFAAPSDVEAHVKSWVKLQELIFVLRGTLKDIDRHWGDGAGPLALHFRVEELRSLIKALFQNTQIRANVLAKIK